MEGDVYEDAYAGRVQRLDAPDAPSTSTQSVGGMFSNCVPHRDEPGWGRRTPGGASGYVLKLCSPPERARMGPRWTGRPHRFYASGQ